MKAVYIKEFGGPENLEIREVPEPREPQGSEVRVRVRAVGLNRADIMQRRGKYPPPTGFSPNIPGLEFAGEIVENGPFASKFKTGDRVFGITAGEAQAELIVIDESLLAAIPANLDYSQAAAFPEAFITAHDALFTQAHFRPTETLLIHAVGSGVGLAALQLAKERGCFVIGTSRTASKLEKCVEFGLDRAIAAGSPPIFADNVKAATDGRGTDVVLDLVGGNYFPESLASLAVKGRIMLVGLTAGRSAEINLGTALYKRAKIIGTALRARSNAEKAEAVRLFSDEVVPLIAAGKLNANLDEIFAFEDIRRAHEYMESNDSFGKIVLELRN
ncbi:MAG: NAD(P)H-quinone oxidoreductase [Pyrinomonadaceae bacterium]